MCTSYSPGAQVARCRLHPSPQDAIDLRWTYRHRLLLSRDGRRRLHHRLRVRSSSRAIGHLVVGSSRSSHRRGSVPRHHRLQLRRRKPRVPRHRLRGVCRLNRNHRPKKASRRYYTLHSSIIMDTTNYKKILVVCV